MDDIDKICVFCKQPTDGGLATVTVTRGLAKILSSSLERKDGLHEKVKGKVSICVHVQCRQNYTRPTSIKASSSKASTSSADSTTSFKLRATDRMFNFKNNCFLCGEETDTNLKYPAHRRRSVHNVQTLEIRDTVLHQCDTRNDDWGEIVKTRLLSVNDLVAPEARYHGDCYKDFLKKKSEVSAGRPKSGSDTAFQLLCESIENSDDSQFSMRELQDTMSRFLQEKEVTETYSDYHLKNLLLKHFGDRMIVSKVVGKTNVFCLAETAHKIIETWYTDRDNDPQTERLRIVLAAADIVREDIQKKAYESNVYPDVEDILSGGENLVPSSLKLFTQRVIQNKKKKGSSKVNRTCNAVNHAIISAVRPRSFLSPLHIGLSLTLHRLYGSKHLIDLLSSMGVCASYYESSTYLNSLINAGSPDVGNDCFIQHVFDNADVNVRTLDGLDTFHSMGGIQCITPGKSVDTKIKVDKIQSGSINSKLTEIRTLAYPRKKNASLKMKAVDYDDLKIMVPSPTHLKLCLFPLTIMWTVGLKNNPGWNGFMHVLSSTKSECDSTYILALPFINMDPSNMSTIYSALCFAVQECRKRNQSCVVTFDQPLFLKSSEIVQNADPDSDLSKVILRLGGFHLLMSYMGSIGRIMEGSGLEKLWESVYGHNTVNHMLSGHAYSRSIRAFTLTTASLVIVLREQYPQLDEQLKKLESVYDQLLNHERDTEDFETNPSTYQDISRIEEILDGIRNSSRTAKLWINLITCVDLMLRFIFAERTGNWDIHLHTCLEMLPYFHAAGHLPYAKSAHIYAQEMLQLESKLTKEEFQLFTKKGYFTVRRKGHFWSGVWTDMSIEQSLMRPMKSIGGLTHGRGFSDSTLSKWILGTPYCLKIHEAVEEYLDCSLTFNEQHVELRLSRKRRDECDIEKFTLWLRQYNPFTKLSGDLVSLASGFVSNENVNCDNAYEVGVAAMKKMSGISFGEMKLHRKDMVVTQATHKTVMVRSKAVTVNPQQLFNRILCVCETPNKLKKYLEYELACTPPSMFDDLSLRKGAKSTFTKVFSEGIIEEIPLQDAYIVVDGGFLLHYVPWPSEATYGDIVQNYCSFVLSRYGRNCTVVFDGYPDEPTTKEQEQSRRSLKNSSCSIDFESHTKCLTKKELFLSNKNNKKKIIMALSAELAIKNINSVTAEGDADVAIVRTGLNNAEQFPATIVVGSDTDLLVLLVALAPENKSVYFCKMTAGKNSSEVYYSIQKLITQHSTIRKHLLFAHAVSGCDTTSALFGVGKIKAADLLKNDLEARCIAGEFIKKEASREKLLKDGERFLLAMYGLSTYSSLSEARYFRFTRLTSKSSLRSNFDLAKLPPTSEAAYQHLLRVYLQVQWWLDNPLQPTEWGWRHEHSEKTKSLRPVPNSKVFAPDDLLRLVSCKCKTTCGPYCGCRKSGMNCSSMCEICNGLSCLNAPSYDENIDSLMDE